MAATEVDADSTLTDGTEQTLSTLTDAGAYGFQIDCNAMAAGDAIDLRFYSKGNAAGTERLCLGPIGLVGAQAEAIKTFTFGLTSHLKVTIQRVSGTDRTYPWCVMKA